MRRQSMPAHAPSPHSRHAGHTKVDRSNGVLEDRHLEMLERWLDTSFRLPVIGTRFGLDGIVGLIPVVGDLVTAGLSGLFILDAWKSGARRRTIARMAGNIGIDLVVGAVPLIGDLLDFGFRSNSRNLALLRSERRHTSADRS